MIFKNEAWPGGRADLPIGGNEVYVYLHEEPMGKQVQIQLLPDGSLVLATDEGDGSGETFVVRKISSCRVRKDAILVEGAVSKTVWNSKGDRTDSELGAPQFISIPRVFERESNILQFLDVVLNCCRH